MFPKKSAQKAQKAPYRASRAVQIRFLEDEETPAVFPIPLTTPTSATPLPLSSRPELRRSGGICSASACLTSRLPSPYGTTATPVPPSSSAGPPETPSPTVSAKPSTPPAAHCRSLKLCASFMGTSRPAVSTLLSKHSLPSAPWTCVASPPAEDPPPAGPPSQPTNTRKTRNR